MKRVRVLLVVILLSACIKPNSVSRVDPDVSLNSWSQTFIDPQYDVVEVTWQVSGGFPEEVGVPDVTFRITCSDNSAYELEILRSGIYGPEIIEVYTDLLDVGGKQATDVSINRIHFR